MKRSEDIKYNSPDIISKLKDLMRDDIEGFTNLILECFRLDEDSVIEDPAPPSSKLKALYSMLQYLETTERFEDCAFVKKLIDKIEDEQ
jgi:hypothetical protein